jgi:hypothetical protein
MLESRQTPRSPSSTIADAVGVAPLCLCELRVDQHQRLAGLIDAHREQLAHHVRADERIVDAVLLHIGELGVEVEEGRSELGLPAALHELEAVVT